MRALSPNPDLPSSMVIFPHKRSYNSAGCHLQLFKKTPLIPEQKSSGRTQSPVLKATSSMNVAHSTHQFADAANSRVRGLSSHDCELIIRQKPEHAKVAVGKEKDRKPVDPPPIIQLKISPASDPNQNYLQSPYFFMSCSLVGPDDGSLPPGPLGTALAGTLVSSLHRLKDQDNNDGAFFVFGDLSIKIEGSFRLQFNLYEMRDKECYHIKNVRSDPFPVYSHKNFTGMTESTFLTRSFSDQGVRLRLRKEPRTLLRKRGPASDDYQPRQYRNHNRQQSNVADRPVAPESPETLRQGQPDHGDSMQIPMHSQSYDQRPPMGRGYSQQSSASISGSYSDEASSKRPRTGSEHSATFSQHQPLDSPQYPGRMYSDQSQSYSNPFAQQTQQQPYGYNYTQSPSSVSNRDQYFAQRLNTQTDNSSAYDPNSQRSPQSAYFPPQPQAVRYQQQPLIAPSPPQRIQSTQSAFEGLGLNTRPLMAAGMHGQIAPIMTGMAPPTYGRMNTSPSYSTMTGSPMGRREMYSDYSTQGQNISTTSMGGALMSSRAPITTSAPGHLDPPF